MSDGLFLAYVDCGQQPHRKAAAPPQQLSPPPPPPPGDYPVGICHAHVSDGQVWIEGIRVHPGHRRRGIASVLVGSAERLALDELGYEQRRGGRGGEAEGRTATSRMLVDVTNDPSIAMTRLLGYRATRTWTYYSLTPQRRPGASLANDGNSGGGSSSGGGGECSVVWDAGAVAAHLDASVHSHYVDSWKWFETDENALRDLASRRLVAVTPAAGPRTRGAASSVIPTVSIATVSGSAERPGGRELYAALYPGSDPAHVAAMVAHLADVAARGGCRSASVFSQDDSLPACDGLARSLAFHLVEKTIPHS